MTAPANACSCWRCKGACSHKPGWFLPEQIAPLAEALGLSEAQLFNQHLQIDWWSGTEATGWEDVFVLSPAVTSGEAGDMFDRDPTGRCRWLKGGKCAIHEIGKPFECATYHHTRTDEDGSRTHEEVAVAWNKPEHQEKIERLLGRKPEVTGSWSIFDQMGMGAFNEQFTTDD